MTSSCAIWPVTLGTLPNFSEYPFSDLSDGKNNTWFIGLLWRWCMWSAWRPKVILLLLPSSSSSWLRLFEESSKARDRGSSESSKHRPRGLACCKQSKTESSKYNPLDKKLGVERHQPVGRCIELWWPLLKAYNVTMAPVEAGANQRQSTNRLHRRSK